MIFVIIIFVIIIVMIHSHKWTTANDDGQPMHSLGYWYDSEMWTGFKLCVWRQMHSNISEVGVTNISRPINRPKVVGTTLTNCGELRMLNDVGIFQGSRRDFIYRLAICSSLLGGYNCHPWHISLATLKCKNNRMFFFSPPLHFESHHVVSTLPFNCDPRFTTFWWSNLESKMADYFKRTE